MIVIVLAAAGILAHSSRGRAVEPVSARRAYRDSEDDEDEVDAADTRCANSPAAFGAGVLCVPLCVGYGSGCGLGCTSGLHGSRCRPCVLSSAY